MGAAPRPAQATASARATTPAAAPAFHKRHSLLLVLLVCVLWLSMLLMGLAAVPTRRIRWNSLAGHRMELASIGATVFMGTGIGFLISHL